MALRIGWLSLTIEATYRLRNREQLTTGTRVGSLIGVLSDPRVRLGIGTAALLGTARAACHDRVSQGEARVFRAVNGLPDALQAPAWAIMQLGTLGAVPAAAGAAWLADDRELAGLLLASGTSTWALAKLVKQVVRRPRPAALLPGTRRRGRCFGRCCPSPPRAGRAGSHRDRDPAGGPDPALRRRPPAARHRGRRGAGTRR